MKKQVLRLILTISIVAIIYLGVQMFTPIIVLEYYEQNGYSFLDDVAYINEAHYQEHIVDPNETVIFENETLIHLDYLSINETQFDVVFSNQDIFDIGMMSDFFSVDPISFYPFDFVHGSYFIDINDIVITETISLALFGVSNSVDQTVVIDDAIFRVSGVLKSNNSSMDYIYIPLNQVDVIGSDVSLALTYRLFKHDNIYSKLYERGGMNLVHYATSQKNQSMIQSTTKLIISVGSIVAGFAILGIANIMNKHKKQVIVSNEHRKPKRFIEIIVKSYVAITIIIVYFGAIFLTNFSVNASYEVAFMYLRDNIHRFDAVLYLYLIPVFIYAINKVVRHFKH